MLSKKGGEETSQRRKYFISLLWNDDTVKTRTHQQEKHFMSLVENLPSNLVMTQMTSYCCNKLLMERLTLQSDVDGAASI